LDLRTELADTIRALVDPYEHAETLHLRSPTPGGPTTEIRIHRTHFPSLLNQLATAIEPARGAGTARGYESSPTARLDAIDRLTAIDHTSRQWCQDLHTPARNTTDANLRALVGATTTEDELDDLTRAARRWLTWARICTGWDTPPRRLREPCPACNHKGGLRVRIDDLNATCLECGNIWDRDTIGLLGDYIRWHNNEPQEENAAA